MQKTICYILLCCLILSACKKLPGEGGLATIKGKIYAKDYDVNGFLRGEGYIPEERVYISYGADTNVSNEVRTSYNGEYKFEFLQKGKYSIFVYTNCDTCGLGVRPVVQKVEITTRKQVITLADINITK